MLGLSKLPRSRIGGLLQDAVYMLSDCIDARSAMDLWELCRVYAARRRQINGQMRLPRMLLHYPDFRNFLLAYREIFVRHSYAFKSTRSNPRIFDCGANIGLATLFFKSWYPESSVLCFEPDPSAYAALRLNVERNGLKDVRHFNLALWDSDGEIDFYITPDRAGNVRNSAVAGRVNGDTIHVPAKRLSSFIGDERVDLLKLDVEGAEQRVLCDLSASGKLSQVDAIFVEYHHRIADNSAQLSEFLSILERAGFEYHLDCRWRPGYTGSQSQDVLIYAARW